MKLPALLHHTLVFCALGFQSSSAFFAPLQRAALKGELKKACERKDVDKILGISEELKKLNPTTDIRKEFNKLEGDWKLDFTTAPAQEVPDDDVTGVKTFQSIDTKSGIIYNIIDRGLPEKGLKIAVGAEATRADRVALDFQTIEAFNDSFPKKVTLRFPPRNFFRTLSKAKSVLTGNSFDEIEFKEIAHFDIIFLDDNLRIQRNSEGNLFVNSRIELLKMTTE
eukprot:CAMPEP_0194216754 /NCGR_PEP_ID=MMETSP0156-20130528/19608_1 /TAXON_ID=33649 /ORGANISM="Thalassionema nitzschioides, Strain L26-B" /LENGTH=223 /DNA_ID=CAMNT_0038945591 /DNA_START=71 /DNA_END=742 /DNA_ORIENTATION=+